MPNPSQITRPIMLYLCRLKDKEMIEIEPFQTQKHISLHSMIDPNTTKPISRSQEVM